MSATTSTETVVDDPTPSAPPAPSSTPARTVHIVLVVDRSGSMEKIRQDVIGGINGFLADQAAQPGACKLTMVQFDTQGYDYLYLASDLDNVNALTEADFVPRGGTNLYDAIGRAITELDVRAGTLKTPEVILFAIFTDGEENSSRTYNRQSIFVMIEEHQAKGWTFTYMGANQDAYAESAAMGISRMNTQAYAGDGGGTQAVYASFATNTRAMRETVMKGGSVDSTVFFASKGAEDDLLARMPDDKAAKAVRPGSVDDDDAFADAVKAVAPLLDQSAETVVDGS